MLTEGLGLWEKALGAKVNYEKSAIIQVGTKEFHNKVPEAKVMGATDLYKYLGVPVGVEDSEAVLTFWNKFKKELGEAVGQWRG